MAIAKTAVIAMLSAAALLLGGCGSLVPPPDPEVRTSLGRAESLLKRGKAAQARAVTQSILAGNPADWSVHLAVFRMWAEKQRPREAAEAGLLIVDRRDRMTRPRTLSDREFAAVALYVAQVLWAGDRSSDAERALDAAVRADPRNAEAANELAYHLAEQGRNLPRALRLAKTAVKLAPRKGYIVDTLGWVYFKMGRITEAREWLGKAVLLAPDDGELRAHLARAHLSAGHLPGAYVEMQKALVLSPYLPEARSLRAAIIRRYNPPGPL